jgi:hypothetical protein
MQNVDVIIYTLLVLLYYLFLKTALDVFTYKEDTVRISGRALGLSF